MNTKHHLKQKKIPLTLEGVSVNFYRKDILLDFTALLYRLSSLCQQKKSAQPKNSRAEVPDDTRQIRQVSCVNNQIKTYPHPIGTQRQQF